MEQWKSIAGTKYEISNQARIRNTKTGKVLKQKIGNAGYAEICLCEHNKKYHKLVHRLVAEAFFGPIPDGMEINHKDENRLNNCFDNLELCSHKDNINYGTRNKRCSISNIGKKRTAETRQKISLSKSTPVNMIDKTTGEILQTFPSVKTAADFLCVTKNSTINRACNGKRKTAYGYKWAYVQH